MSSDMIDLFFLKAGKARHLRAGDRLIVEGEKVGSVFLVTNGDIAIKKRERVGAPLKHIAMRHNGALLGELSFLLGQTATVTLEAASGKVTVLDVPQPELMKMLSSDPQLAGGFFRLLGGTLAERISEVSAGMRNSLFHSSAPQPKRGGGGSDAALAILPESLDRPVYVSLRLEICHNVGDLVHLVTLIGRFGSSLVGLSLNFASLARRSSDTLTVW